MRPETGEELCFWLLWQWKTALGRQAVIDWKGWTKTLTDKMAETPKTWLGQAAARQAARDRWLRLATAPKPNTILVASAESDLFAAGGDMTDLILLRQKAHKIRREPRTKP